MADALLDQLLGPVAIAPRGSGVAAVVRDLWLGGMPLPQAAAAAGVTVTVTVTEELLPTLGFNVAPTGRRTAEPSGARPDGQRPAAAAPKRPQRLRMKRRADIVRLYGEGWTIRAVAAGVGMRQREVWRQLGLAGVTRRPRVTAGSSCPTRRCGGSMSTSGCRSLRWRGASRSGSRRWSATSTTTGCPAGTGTHHSPPTASGASTSGSGSGCGPLPRNSASPPTGSPPN